MLSIQNGADRAIIILHEIYGLNDYIDSLNQRFADRGYDTYCPDLLGGKVYDYSQQPEAYRNFCENVGFDAFTRVLPLMRQLRQKYGETLLLGSSVGGTLAWRAAAAEPCDGLIACYGSRIRDYPYEKPQCPSLLLFAREEPGFDPGLLADKLRSESENTEIHLLDGKHGFLDPFGPTFHPQSAKACAELIDHFLIDRQ